MPKPPLGLEVKAQNIDERLPSILACSPAPKQDSGTRSLFSPQNSQERSPQISQSNNSAPSGKFALRSRLIKQLSGSVA